MVIVGKNMNIVKKNTVAVLDASKEVGLEVNRRKGRKCLSDHQTAGQNLYIKVAGKSFENMTEFKYFGMVTDKHCIQ
jgi:hypothetical protein